MSVSRALVELAGPRAHPVSGHPHVDVPVLLVVLCVITAVVVALLLTPAATAATGERVAVAHQSWAGRLSGAQVTTRVAAVVLLLLAIVAGRVGVEEELENLAPALIVGVAWPLLTAVSLAFPIWRWVDPWDGMARVLTPGDESAPPGHVWPALAFMLPVAWFIGVYERPLDPRVVGLVLLVYTTVAVAGCLARGRRRWLSSSEPVGIVLTWVHAAGRSQLRPSGLPRGSTLLLGASLGALLFAVLRRTGFWSSNVPVDQLRLYATAGLLACAALGAALVAMGAWSGYRLGDRGAVIAGVPPLIAGVVVALSLERNRFFTSAQLLPQLLGDPLGQGWDLLGAAGEGLDADPLGAAGLLTLQLAVVGVGSVWGAVVAARRSARRCRVVAAVVLGYLAGASALLVSLH